MFVYRSEAAGSLWDGGWLVTGGDDSSSKLSSVLVYSNDEWQEYTSLPVGLDEHCQVTVGSDVFVIGGLIRNGGSSAVSTVYKLSDGIWTIFSSIKTPRRKHMCSVLNGTIYVMGGVGYPVSGYFSSVEMLTPASNDLVAGPPLPAAVLDGQSVLYNNTVFVLGGWSNNVVNTGIYRLDGDNWVTEEVTFEYSDRYVFPSPLLSSDLLYCVE